MLHLIKVVQDNSNNLTGLQDSDRLKIIMKYRWMKLEMLQQDRLPISSFNLDMMDAFVFAVVEWKSSIFQLSFSLMFASYRIK